MLTHQTGIAFATPADLVPLARLSRDEVEQGHGWRYTPQHLAWIMRHPRKNLVVARVGERLAGFGVMTYGGHQANLDLLAVRPAFRRRRVGTQLVEWLVEVALIGGLYNVYVQVRAGNADALAFYRKLGFRQLDHLPGYYSGVESAVLLARTLRSNFRGLRLAR